MLTCNTHLLYLFIHFKLDYLKDWLAHIYIKCPFLETPIFFVIKNNNKCMSVIFIPLIQPPDAIQQSENNVSVYSALTWVSKYSHKISRPHISQDLAKKQNLVWITSYEHRFWNTDKYTCTCMWNKYWSTDMSNYKLQFISKDFLIHFYWIVPD